MNRYDNGPPWEGVDGREAYDRYNQVAQRVPPDVYRDSAQEAFARLSPEQRMQLGQHLQQQVRQQGLPFQDFDRDGVDDRYQDPGFLAQATSRMEQQQPGILGQLLGGGGGQSMLDNPIAKAALAGIAAMAVKRMMGGR